MSKAEARHAAEQYARDAEERAKSLAYISDPTQWVRLLCPVKMRKGTGAPACAYLCGDGPNLYHGNMWAPSKNDRKEEFKDFREIIDAGWVVD